GHQLVGLRLGLGQGANGMAEQQGTPGAALIGGGVDAAAGAGPAPQRSEPMAGVGAVGNQLGDHPVAVVTNAGEKLPALAGILRAEYGCSRSAEQHYAGVGGIG